MKGTPNHAFKPTLATSSRGGSTAAFYGTGRWGGLTDGIRRDTFVKCISCTKPIRSGSGSPV